MNIKKLVVEFVTIFAVVLVTADDFMNFANSSDIAKRCFSLEIALKLTFFQG